MTFHAHPPLTIEKRPLISEVVRAPTEPIHEGSPRTMARARLSSFTRAFEADLVGSPSQRALPLALVEPRLALEFAGSLSQGETLAFTFSRRRDVWRFEVELARLPGLEEATQPLLQNFLRLAAHSAVFKTVPAEVDDAPAHVIELAPIADIATGADNRAIWLPPDQFVEPDLKRALSAAHAFGVSNVRFVIRRFILSDEDLADLRAARFRLEPAVPNCPRAAVLDRWIESNRGVRFDVEVGSHEPLSREALNLLCAALFGRARRWPVGAPDLDLRLGVPAGCLPAFRFWPSARDLTRDASTRVAEIADGQGAVVLGRDAADDTIRLGGEDRMRHLFLLGGTGVGKSTLMLNMILEDASKGEGVILIDPHGDLADAVRARLPAHRREDLIWIDAGEPAPQWRLDFLATRGDNPELERSRIANQFVTLFRQMYANVPEALGPCFEQYFRASLLLLMEAADPADRHLLRFEDVLVDDGFREKLLRACKSPKVLQFWQDTAAHVRGENSLENVAPYITNKMTQITSNPLTAALISGDSPRLDLRTAMDERKIVVIRLSKGVIGDYDARFLGALFLMSLTEAALSRARVPVGERTPFRVYVDEFQTLATQSAADMLAECRKYGLSLVLANQSLSQLAGDKFNPVAVGHAALANCASLALFRMSLGDAAVMAASVDGVLASELTQLGVGEIVIRRLVMGVPTPAEHITGLAPPGATNPPNGEHT